MSALDDFCTECPDKSIQDPRKPNCRVAARVAWRLLSSRSPVSRSDKEGDSAHERTHRRNINHVRAQPSIGFLSRSPILAARVP